MLEPIGEFHSVVVFVRSHGPAGPATSRTGHWLYGWLCRHLLPAESESQTPLHGSRALVCSPLLEESGAAVASLVEPNRRYAFRVAFLEGVGYSQWKADARRWLSSDLKIGPYAFRPEPGWTEDPTNHPLAGSTTAGALMLWGERHANDALKLRFMTPTVFKSTYRWPGSVHPGGLAPIDLDLEYPLPDPARLVSSLAQRWQQFAPPAAAIPEDLLELTRQTTCLSRFDLRTQAAYAGGETRGFVGEAEFRCLAPLGSAKVAFATLCAFAPFSGVGRKTALGMGMVRLEQGR